jgi:hypothetical protein
VTNDREAPSLSAAAVETAASTARPSNHFGASGVWIVLGLVVAVAGCAARQIYFVPDCDERLRFPTSASNVAPVSSGPYPMRSCPTTPTARATFAADSDDRQHPSLISRVLLPARYPSRVPGARIL